MCIHRIERCPRVRAAPAIAARGGYLLPEAVAGVVILGMLLAALVATLHTFNDRHDQMRLRTAALLAAESVLERLRAGAPWSDAAFAEAYPGMHLTLTRAAGERDWQGFDCVSVEVVTTSRRGREIRVSLSGYLPGEQSR